MSLLLSGWFAGIIVVAASYLLYLLYSSGQKQEALIGLGLLAIAILLILLGRAASDRDKPPKSPPPSPQN